MFFKIKRNPGFLRFDFQISIRSTGGKDRKFNELHGQGTPTLHPE